MVSKALGTLIAVGMTGALIGGTVRTLKKKRKYCRRK